MSALKNLEIKNAILCEDIRRELSNKNTLVGVYSGDIQVAEMPGRIKLSFYMEAIAKKSEPIPLEIRISGPGPHSILGKTEIKSERPFELAVLISPAMDIRISEEGQFKIEIREEGGRWKPLISKSVTLNHDLKSL